MRARGNMVWGLRGIARGAWLEKWVLRADSQLEAEAQAFTGGLRKLTVSGPGSLLPPWATTEVWG